MGQLMKVFQIVCCITGFAAVMFPASADLLLSAPPRESAEESALIYGPIAELLSKRTGEPVVYSHAVNWIEYSNSMRNGVYDIVFDGPHFVAWRMKHLGHVPVVKLPGSLVFLLLVRAYDYKVAKLQDLKSSTICSLPPPNLGAMSVLAQFSNPVIQPTLAESLDPSQVMEGLKNGTCRGAVLPERVYKKMGEDARKKLKVMYTSPEYPDQTITVSPKVSEKAREVIAASLAAPGGVPEAARLLAAYTKQATHFEVANSSEFVGLEDLLEGELWGW